MVKVSIIVPMYNVEKYIEQCVTSMLHQTLDDIEIILIDDGSPDNSGTIADRLSTSDERVHVIHKQNAGVGAARNDGLSASVGEYVIFCDGDDWMTPDACKKLYEFAQKNNADVTIGDVYMAYEHEKTKSVKFYSDSFSTDNYSEIIDLIRAVIFRTYCANPSQDGIAFGYGGPWNKLVKRSLLIDNGIKFDVSVKGVFDDILYSAYILACSKKVSYIQSPVYYYRQLESSITHSFKPNVLEINAAIFEAWQNFFEKYAQDDEFYKPFYACVIRRVDEALKLYFVNDKNNKNIPELQAEYKAVISSSPYNEALRKVNLRKISKKQKAIVFLSRLGLTHILWKIYSK